MALTREQFMELRQKGLSVQQIRDFEAGNAPEASTAEAEPDRSTFGERFKQDILTPAVGVIDSIAKPGRTIQRGLAGISNKLFGTNVEVSSNEEAKQNLNDFTGIDLNSTQGKVGSFVGDVGVYAAPTNIAGKVTAGVGAAKTGLGIAARFLGKNAARGAAGVTTAGLQSGELGTNEMIAGGFEAAAGPLGKISSNLARRLSTELPEWLVRPLLKQSKDARAKGKDITNFLVESGRIGSPEELITKTSGAIDDIAKQVDDVIKNASTDGKTIARNDIARQVTAKLNDAGAAIDETEVLSIVERLSPQAKGLLKKEVLTIEEANKLRSSIDRTLGDRGFLRDQLPFNKEVLRDFTNILRNSVKGTDERLVPLFDDYAKNIRLRDALIDQSSSGVAKNSLGIYDLLTGVGAFGATGNPLLGAAAVGGRRAFESGTFKTGAAQLLRNSDDVQRALAKYGPVERAAILEFIDSLGTNTETQSQSVPTPTQQ